MGTAGIGRTREQLLIQRFDSKRGKKKRWSQAGLKRGSFFHAIQAKHVVYCKTTSQVLHQLPGKSLGHCIALFHAVCNGQAESCEEHLSSGSLPKTKLNNQVTDCYVNCQVLHYNEEYRQEGHMDETRFFQKKER